MRLVMKNQKFIVLFRNVKYYRIVQIPVVVTQLKHEGRWLVTVSRDPCPQFLVHNHTSEPLVLAQPVLEGEEPSSTKFPLSECEGIRWWLVVGAGAVMHYSSPAHNERYPPPSPQPPQVQFLTFARARDGEYTSYFVSLSYLLS
ncbi:unnamed protein product [Diatraea saccharalis]|uniref:Uncharacterized protein n=1 Tax=Diatraea saccharalis TaxID=40085 RepID=A0A9N9QTG6_9NEOP|nr:unnamed protein product [Diatraea saccharalis]